MILTIDDRQVDRIAERLREMPAVEAVDFCGTGLGAELFPPENAPWTVDYFFSVTLHQYGFWTDDGQRYLAPYYGLLDGVPRKGAEFMFRAWLRAGQNDPAFFTPEHQAEMTLDRLREALAEDDGTCRLPMLDSHLELARGYGRSMLAAGCTPADIVAAANRSDTPCDTFVESCRQLVGYREDPLQKKSSLLAIILKNRPERFLRIQASELRPVVDYHIQRTFLRTGMVLVAPGSLRSAVADRRFIQAADEAAIRTTVYEAVDRLSARSGKDIAAIDWFFFRMRKTCHEMEAPACADCPVGDLCPRLDELFQPVFRTTAY
jgi:hypothetical protein